MNPEKNNLLNTAHQARNAHILEVIKKNAEKPGPTHDEVMEQYDRIRSQSSRNQSTNEEPKSEN